MKNLGCKGGFVEYAYEYFKSFKAMQSDHYPYTAEDGNCTYSKKLGVTNMKGFDYIAEHDPNAILEELKN
jgi:hypothetical protein